MTIKDKIKKLAQSYYSEIRDCRRYLHAHPELSNQEVNTSNYLAEFLEKEGIKVQRNVFENGLVAIIEGKNPGKKTIALRADMDALPILEENGFDYISINNGVMHACGHDVHMASLLGTAKILNTIKNEFEGSIKLIFQPAEELIPGGAKFQIEEGVLENPKVEQMFAQHVYPELEAGKIGIKSGKYMASTDEINIKVIGKGGHAAMPHDLIDPVYIASQIVVALQQISSRNAKFNIPTVLSFGEFIAKGAYNVIPNEVKIKGTFRTLNEDWRAEAHRRIEEIANGIAESAGGKCEVFINKGYPFLVNDEALSNKAFEAAVDFLGADKVEKLDIRMTGEDFAYFAQKVPSCFYRLGIGKTTKGKTAGLHTSNFDIDESCLETGSGLMAWLSLNELMNS